MGRKCWCWRYHSASYLCYCRVTEPPTRESIESIKLALVFVVVLAMAQEAKKKVSARTSALTKPKGKEKVMLHRRRRRSRSFRLSRKGCHRHSLIPMAAAATWEEGSNCANEDYSSLSIDIPGLTLSEEEISNLALKELMRTILEEGIELGVCQRGCFFYFGWDCGCSTSCNGDRGLSWYARGVTQSHRRFILPAQH